MEDSQVSHAKACHYNKNVYKCLERALESKNKQPSFSMNFLLEQGGCTFIT